MEDGGHSITFAKVTNPNIMNVVANSPCITHPPTYRPPHTYWWWAAVNRRTPFTATSMCGRRDREDFWA